VIDRQIILKINFGRVKQGENKKKSHKTLLILTPASMIHNWRLKMNNTTILVIDDYVPMLDSIEYVLEDNGFNVMTTPYGLTGIRLFQTRTDIDLVITGIKFDYQCIDGIYILKQIKKVNSKIPIIVLSGDDSYSDIAMKNGADSFLSKPILPDRLLEVIKEKLVNR